MGGVKWVSNLHVRKKDGVVCLSDAECSYAHKEGPLLPVEGWHITLKATKPESTANMQGHALQRKGVIPSCPQSMPHKGMPPNLPKLLPWIALESNP